MFVLLLFIDGALYLYTATMPMPDRSTVLTLDSSTVPIPNHQYWGLGESIFYLICSVGLGTLVATIRELLPFFTFDGSSSSGEEDLNEE